jgi:t-SNARE complex subunit (syntaxin)
MMIRKYLIYAILSMIALSNLSSALPVHDRTSEFKQTFQTERDLIQPTIEAEDHNPSTDDDDSSEEDPLSHFYEEVKSIKRGLDLISEHILKFDIENHEDFLTLVDVIKSKLKKMKINIEKSEPKEAQTRIKISHQRALTEKFLQLLEEYKNLESDYSDSLKNKWERQADVVFPNKSEKHGIAGDHLFQENILEDKRNHGETSIALIHLKEQHREIAFLEKQIIELHQIFIEVSTLIEAQDGLVNDLEYQCDQACAWTGEATKVIKIADDYVEKSRKRRCCCYGACCGTICATCMAGASFLALGLAPLAACNVQ